MIDDIRTESPIEVEFSINLFASDLLRVQTNTIERFFDLVRANPGKIVASSQVRVGRYRCDFVLGKCTQGTLPYVIAVECDGARHHTDEHHKRQDEFRDMLLTGRHRLDEVIRFTGREIHNDAAHCVAKALNAIDDNFKRESASDARSFTIGEIMQSVVSKAIDRKNMRQQA